jgi:hypothetical protein
MMNSLCSRLLLALTMTCTATVALAGPRPTTPEVMLPGELECQAQARLFSAVAIARDRGVSMVDIWRILRTNTSRKLHPDEQRYQAYLRWQDHTVRVIFESPSLTPQLVERHWELECLRLLPPATTPR